MKYMELVADNGTVISVAAVEQPNYVRYVKRHNIFVGCTEKEAEAVAVENQICYLADHEDLKSVKDDIILNAVFIDKDEYDRLSYLATVEPEEAQGVGENEPGEQPTSPEVMSDLDVKLEVLKLKATVEEMQKGIVSPSADEATVKFYETLSDSSTNSIAKIRAAAQQYLADTAAEEN